MDVSAINRRPTAAQAIEAGTGEFKRTLIRSLNRLVFASLLALLPLLAIPYGAVEPWWESVFECAVFAITALWLLEGLLGGELRLGGYETLAPALGLALLAFLQSRSWWGAPPEVEGRFGSPAGILGTAAPYETWRFAYKLIALVLAGAMLRSHLTNNRRLSALIQMVTLVAVASALFGIVRQTTQYDPAHPDQQGFLLAYLRAGEGYGQFINRNHFAFLMEMAFGLLLGLLAGGGVRRDRALIFVAAMIPLLTALALSSSRGGIGGLLCQAPLLALLFKSARGARPDEEPGEGLPALLERAGRSPFARYAAAACLVLGLAVGVVWLGGDPLVNRLEALPADMRAAMPSDRKRESRVDIWRATWGLIATHPGAGVGMGAYATAIPSSHDSSGEMIPSEAHNDYLELLASGGVIGALLGAWFVMAFIKRARAQLRATDPFRRAACLGAVLGLFGVAVHSLVDFGLHITINALVCVALIAIATPGGEPAAPRASR